MTLEESTRLDVSRLDAAARDLVRIVDIVDRYPLIKRRTLEVWIQKAEAQTMTVGCREVPVPGTPNGLAPAIVRKGRTVYIRLSLFLAWWLEGSTDAAQSPGPKSAEPQGTWLSGELS